MSGALDADLGQKSDAEVREPPGHKVSEEFVDMVRTFSWRAEIFH